MKLRFKHEHEGVWFSENGHKAYLRGEKPLFMWDDDDAEFEPTCTHHIQRRIPGVVVKYSHRLVMFYRRVS